jgi:hypothetical protein
LLADAVAVIGTMDLVFGKFFFGFFSLRPFSDSHD